MAEPASGTLPYAIHLAGGRRQSSAVDWISRTLTCTGADWLSWGPVANASAATTGPLPLDHAQRYRQLAAVLLALAAVVGLGDLGFQGHCLDVPDDAVKLVQRLLEPRCDLSADHGGRGP